MQMSPDEQNARNMRDFLVVYNKMTEYCFTKCVHNMNYSKLTDEEVTCVERCSGKNIGINNRIMQRFIDIQVDKQQTMLKQMTENQESGATDNVTASTSLSQSEGTAPPPDNTTIGQNPSQGHNNSSDVQKSET